jgi:hypothetical protein
MTMDSMRAVKTGGGQGLVRGATATKDMNNTAKTAGQCGVTLFALPKFANKLESTKKKTSAGLVHVRSWEERSRRRVRKKSGRGVFLIP